MSIDHQGSAAASNIEIIDENINRDDSNTSEDKSSATPEQEVVVKPASNANKKNSHAVSKSKVESGSIRVGVIKWIA